MIPHEFIQYFYPILLAVMLLEVILLQHNRQAIVSWQECLASFGVAIGHRFIGTMFGVISLSVYTFAWDHRLFTVSLNQGWTILLLFVGLEFFYYWYHRCSHEVRWFWATHSVHHSSNHFNLSTSFRLGWTGSISGHFLFFTPLCWLGFSPKAIALSLGINLLYQFWIHTELIPKLGWLEYIFNTPSHHRVHHASNPEYIDRNYGGVLIIFDRLFGTYAEEQRDRLLIYGLTQPLRSHNPIRIAFHEWQRLFQDLIVAKSWGDRFRVIGGRPT